ncbi:hypothetical protein PNEG_03400 [Pneumocystis murina B123]|uniref:Cytochrome b5 heme-binding domain-containing protein n=1 Tax=Pneumocystis murina (strain B123) TaxID=1069680 RepID=M7NM08_PNEMU|nr:hypothetical protein PNEG_03400 [Pneumocystis murina B123]EMR08232.1 hypothetical protein PNEG_03400 [Pneumocystis murina B123]
MVENIEINTLRKIEASEVAKHVTRDDIYMVIDKMVYNVSPFINEHPGGEEVLLDVAGKDATDAFEDVGHSDEARDILKKLVVGKLEGKMEESELRVKPDLSVSRNNFNLKLCIITVSVSVFSFLMYMFLF